MFSELAIRIAKARIARERGIEADAAVPGDFPVLTKSILMTNFDEIVTRREITKRSIAEFLSRSHDPTELFLGKYRVIHTSGSSGEVGYFVYSPEDWARGAALGSRRRQRPSVRKRRKSGRFRFAFFGATDGHYAGVTMMSSFSRGLARFFVDVRLYEINSPLHAVIHALNAFQPHFLAGYTTALKILADKQRQGELTLSLLGIAASGEATTAADKAVLEQAFGCGVANGYGSSEHLVMGMAMPEDSEIVLYDDELIYEFHDDHSVVTNLFNHTVPLIRYRMADVLRPVASDKHAPYLVIEGLVGRNELQPTFTNREGAEDFISPHTINEIFVPGVTRFQMQLTSDTSFRFLICLDPLLDTAHRQQCVAEVAARLRDILARKLMDNVMFEVVVADDLPVNPRTRKFQLIVDQRPQLNESATALPA